MSYKLFLDDIREPFWIYDDYKKWIVVRNQEEFIKTITDKGIPNVISFDNDLGVDNNGIILSDGYSCLNWLIDNDIYIKGVIVHSDNIVANEQIFGKAKNWQKFAINEKMLNVDEVFVIKRPSMNHLRDEYKKREI